MPVRNQNWYDLQEGRRYPLDDRSTGVSDADVVLADNIIVDCHIRFPASLGEFACVSAITVSPGIVTVLINATDDVDQPTEYKPIAAISLAKPIERGVNQPLMPLVPGVAGWIAFGSGIGENFVGRYQTPIQGLISPRCARPYRELPIPTLGKINLNTALTNLVNIKAKTPVEATYEKITVDGQENLPAIVFRLVGELSTYNPLTTFGGPCKGRPESGTCGKPGIENINGVKPDCSGNVQIRAEGFTISPFQDCGGFDLITDKGLSAACADSIPAYKKRYKDLCHGSESENSDGLMPWYNPLDQIPIPPDIVSSISLGLCELGSCFPENTCFDFVEGSAPEFVTLNGLFVFEVADAPHTCETAPTGLSVYDPPGSLTTTESMSAGFKYTYVAADVSGINVSLMRHCFGNINAQNKISTVLRLSGSPRRNGGVILNYVCGDSIADIPTTFIAAVIDIDGGGIQIVRFNGSNIVVEARAAMEIKICDWYEIEATAIPQGAGMLVSMTAKNKDDPTISASLSTVVQKYGQVTNAVGLFSNMAYTYFSRFIIGG